MKLRFDYQSLRLRVRKSDLEKLTVQGFIEETVVFPSGALTYRLAAQGNVVHASIQAEQIEIGVPEVMLRQWIDSEEVGIYASLETGKPDQLLQILLEKDFPCQHGSAGDNADSFGELAEKRKH